MKKILRWIERIGHSIGLLIAIVAIVGIGVIVGRPSEKSGSQPTFAGAEQQQNRQETIFHEASQGLGML